jgi:hypothetical protein
VLPATLAKSTDESSPIVAATASKELFQRSLLAPALIAHILVAKYVLSVDHVKGMDLRRSDFVGFGWELDLQVFRLEYQLKLQILRSTEW